MLYCRPLYCGQTCPSGHTSKGRTKTSGWWMGWKQYWDLAGKRSDPVAPWLVFGDIIQTLLSSLGGPVPLFPYCSPRDLSFGLALLAAGGFSWSCVPGLSSVLRCLSSLSQFHVLLSQALLFFREYSPANSTLPGLLGSPLTPWSLRFAISVSVKPAQHQVENTGSVLTLTVPSTWTVGCDEMNLGNQCLRPCD